MTTSSLLLTLLALLAGPGGDDRTLLTYHPRTWYADILAGPARASADGRFLLYSMEEDFHLAEVGGESLRLAEGLGWEVVYHARWTADGARLYARGRANGGPVSAFHDLEDGSTAPSTLPDGVVDELFTSSPDRTIGLGRIPRGSGEWGTWLLDAGAEPRLLVPVTPNGWAVSSDARTLALLFMTSTGWSELRIVDLESGEERTLGRGPRHQLPGDHAGLRAGDREVFLSLVGAEREEMAAKHDPLSERDLDIHAIALEDGRIRPVVVGPGDDLVSGVVDGRLLWTRLETSMRTGVVPFVGGEVTPLLGEQTSYPYWHPDGDRISVMFGAWHLADWALNWDLGVVPVDGAGRPTGEMRAEVVGPHEDFAMVWSPDGRWVAYHSHRSPTPGPSYRGGGPPTTSGCGRRRAARSAS